MQSIDPRNAFSVSVRWVVGILWLALVVGATSTVIAQRQPSGTANRTPPAEGTLPDEPVKEADVALPDESQLPSARPIVVSAPGEDQLPSPSVPVGVEGAIADDNAAAINAAGAVPDELPGAGLPGGVRPWLRMDFEGHTGVIRTLDLSDDGVSMVSAGEDKDVHVWRRSGEGNRDWMHLRTLRWPITRGPRGRIYSAAIRDDWVAFAGHGASGAFGEIRIVDYTTGEMPVEPLLGEAPDHKHRQVVAALAWSSSAKPQLASIDVQGRLMLWRADDATGLWRGRTLVRDDDSRYAPEVAASLRPYRDFVPLTFCGDRFVVVPRYAGVRGDVPIWHLAQIDIETGAERVHADVDHLSRVVALDASHDGNTLISCDWRGQLAVWKFDAERQATVRTWKPDAPALSIDLHRSGERLLMGSRLHAANAGSPLAASLQTWDLATDVPTLSSTRVMKENVRQIRWDSEFSEAIVSQVSRIETFSIDDDRMLSADPTATLSVPAKPIFHVAFAASLGNYRVGFSTTEDTSDPPKVEGVFDLRASKLLGRGAADNEGPFLRPQRTETMWDVVPVQTEEGARAQVVESGEARGVLPLRFEKHGFPTAWCPLPELPKATDSEDVPAAVGVIVGTTGRNGIYVYSADQSGPPRLLRQFRGHSGSVFSLGVSPDRRYLASGGDDATIAIWNLDDVEMAPANVNRWGVDFEIDGNQIVAAEVRENGPLHFRGVRTGDQLMSIQWADESGNVLAPVVDAEEMFQSLATCPFDRLVVFQFRRGGAPLDPFQSFPAWRPLARLFVDQQREWAFWTPAGYYDASFNGHQRFGWQVNRGISRKPDFFRAAQFRQALERPEVMQRLLMAGSLPAAMRQTVSRVGPPPGQQAIVNQYQNKPRIEVLTPRAGSRVENESLTVRARIVAPRGASLVRPRAFISGVPPIASRRLSSPDNDVGTLFEWDFALPSEADLQLEVLAATEAEAVERVWFDLHQQSNKAEAGDEPKNRLYFLAMGVSSYADPQIPSLRFATDAAVALSEVFGRKSSPLYRVSTDRLLDRDATRPMWRLFAENAVRQLSPHVRPDDLVILYLCGHGIRDRRTDDWYFVTADCRYSDLMNDEYADCLAFEDLAALAALPCRKLALLDSCHSGAVQPVMQRNDLKSALRLLQDDLVLTLTASEGDEEAAEQDERRMGRFTAKLVEALQGAADDGDGIVSLDEVVRYVTRTVAEESEREGIPQHPTATPAYLLPTLSLPLAVAGKANVGEPNRSD